jgi:hypothetical protein
MKELFQNKLLPLMKKHSGFRGIFVLNNPGENKDICLTLWEKIVDMETFNIRYLALKDEIIPLLTVAPEVEIFQVALPDDAVPPGIMMSESSLGIRIQKPFEYEYSIETT